MKVKIKIEKEVEIKTLQVEAGVRYWEDATVNGIEDIRGDIIPCRNGDDWSPTIDIDTGTIINWRIGATADVHYKVCDDGAYFLKDSEGNVILKKQGYVPNGLIPGEYGDYIIMKIDENGKILNWPAKPSFSDFLNEDED